MKAATGELNLTIVTVVAIGALLTFFGAVFWPQIRTALQNTFNNQDQTIAMYVETL